MQSVHVNPHVWVCTTEAEWVHASLCACNEGSKRCESMMRSHIDRRAHRLPDVLVVSADSEDDHTEASGDPSELTEHTAAQVGAGGSKGIVYISVGRRIDENSRASACFC